MTAPLDVAVATCVTLPEPDPDEPLLLDALSRAGLAARMLAWDDPEARFSDARMVLLRSTWNYPWQAEAFLSWAERQGARLVNAVSIVRYNIHKSYLADLQRAGIPAVPTVHVARGTEESLAALLASRDLRDVVVKPAVSAASYRTRRVSAAALGAEDEAFYRELVRDRDAMVQPYVRSVDDYGERAVVWIDGEVTHSVRKSPRLGGQDEHVSAALPVAGDEADIARAAVAHAAARAGGVTPLYARIDVVRDEGGRPMVSELEMMEPSLFFTQSPAALSRFVRAVARRLAG
jgi:glutathione synthase/RimK-type ligase-like ATP-grasp enzyme